MLILSGFMNSSRRISPGWIGSSVLDGFMVISSSVLVVIHNLNVIRIAVTPGEANPPLVVDPNAVCPGAIAPEQFKLVSRRYPKILQAPCLMEVQELPPRRPLDGLKSTNQAVLKERRRICAFERPDQTSVYDV